MILDENTMAMITPTTQRQPYMLHSALLVEMIKLAIDSDDLAEDDPVIVCKSYQPSRRTTHTTTPDTYEIKFLVLILGARTPPPKMDAPVTKIPLPSQHHQLLHPLLVYHLYNFYTLQKRLTTRHQIHSDRYTAPPQQAPTHKAMTLQESCRH